MSYQFLCICCMLLLSACSSQSIQSNHAKNRTSDIIFDPAQNNRLSDIALLFNEAKTQAVFVSYDGVQLHSYGNDLARADRTYNSTSALQVTPKQEVKLIYQQALHATSQKQLKEKLYVQRRGNAKLYAQSSWIADIHPQVGWYTGWVEQSNGKIIAFTLNMQMKEGDDPLQAQQLTLDVLDKLGLFFYL